MRMKYKAGLIIIIVSSLLFAIYITLQLNPDVYEHKGCISGNCLDGFGVMRFSNGSTYTGTWKNGFMHGFGTHIMGSGEFEGDIFEGEFEHGEYNGKGVYFFSKYDAKLMGKWKNGKPDGLCTVFFGINSLWSSIYQGEWANGENTEFQNFLTMTKKGESFVANAAVFYDTINYYYKSIDLQHIIDEIGDINQSDLTRDRVSLDQIIKLAESINTLQYELSYSIEMINAFREFDSTLQYRNATVEYLNCFKTGIDDEFSKWILTIQHNPSMDKPYQISEILLPFVKRTNFAAKKWEKMKIDFKEKYKIIRSSDS